MRSTILPLSLLLFSGCAGLPVDVEPGTSPDAAGVRGQRADPPPTHARQAAPSRRDCRMIRAIDGYARCATGVRAVAPMARPRPVAVALPDHPTDAAQTGQTPGEYLVIGSFRERGNARRWAAFNAEFGTRVFTTERGGDPFYRVLVGPLDDGDSTVILREILESAGAGTSWRMSICGPSARPGACRRTFKAANLTAIADL